LVGDCLCCCWC